MDLFLDIETRSFPRLRASRQYITVVGFYHEQTGLAQMIWPDITKDSLLDVLPKADHVYTYNGNNFDLPVIRHQLGLDLHDHYKSRDLMYACWREGLKGGLKAVERQLGISRTEHLDNWDIQRCWTAWKHKGDDEALKRLLKYNEEDVMNLVEVKNHLGL